MLRAIEAANKPVALTGAGISAPSGAPTFEIKWKGRPVREFLGRDYYRRDPVGFFELFCAMEQWNELAPNAAHLALAARAVPVITQNIDGLHQHARSVDVIELHGNLRTIRCSRCEATQPAGPLCRALRPLYAAEKTKELECLLRCQCGAWLDADVVLYGDAVRGIDEAVSLVEACDLLLVIGSSLTTYPAAALPEMARRRGAKVLIENDDCIGALTEV